MKLKRTISAGVMSLGLVVGTAGFVGATTSGSNTTTGPDSVNVVKNRMKKDVDINNNNNISAANSNDQSARSGRAGVYHNTTGGSAGSGNASNANSLSANVTVDNTGAAKAALAMPESGNFSGTNSNTGPDSKNIVKNTSVVDVDVTNNNNLTVTNTNSQTATTGSAKVAGNTTGGSATSGNASNTNSTSLTFKVSN